MWRGGEREIHLLDYWKILVKRRWVFLTLFTTTVALVGLWTMLLRPVYTATVRLQIERRAPKVLPFQEVSIGGDAKREFHETQFELIRSRRVARDVIQSLRLKSHPEFAVAVPEALPAGVEAEAFAEGRRVDKLLSRLHVLPVAKSHLVDVSFDSFDRELAARVANRVAESYIAFNSEARYNTTERATASLGHQVANLQEDIEAKERELQEYAREHGIVRLEDEQDIQMRKLRDLQVAYSRAQAARIEKEARFAALRGTPPAEIPEVMDGKLVQELTGRSAALAQRFAQMSEKFKPDWPEMVRLRAEMEETERRLERQRAGIGAALVEKAEREFRQARNEERGLERALEELEEEIRRLQLREIRYNQVRAEIENRRGTLNALVQRQTETSSSYGVSEADIGNVRIVDPAEVPNRPSGPDIPLNLLVGALLGMLLGGGSSFALEYIDCSVKSAEEMQEIGGLTCIGTVPKMRSAGRFPRPARKPAEGRVEVVCHADPVSEMAEAFREIRTSLLVSRPGGSPRTFLITSPQQGDGKTSTALNLAIALAQKNRKVLLVDADLRRPRLQRLLETEEGPGLTHYLTRNGPVRIEPVATAVPGLALVPSGPIPPNPAALLDSPLLDQVQREILAMEFDHILYDAPPVLAVADPVILANRADAVLLVVRQGACSHQAVAHAIEKLRQVGAPLVGGILNQVDHSGDPYRVYGYRGRYGEKVSPPETGTRIL